MFRKRFSVKVLNVMNKDLRATKHALGNLNAQKSTSRRILTVYC